MKLQIETPSQTLKLLNLTASHSKKPKLEKEACLWSTLRVGRLSDYRRSGSFTC